MPRRDSSSLFIDNQVIETEFLTGWEAADDGPLEPLIQEIPMADRKGHEILLPFMGNEQQPKEEWGTFMPDDNIGAYELTLSPVAWVKGMSLKEDDIRDDRTGWLSEKLSSYGSKFKMHQAKRMVSQVIEGSLTGFDNTTLFSATHNWQYGTSSFASYGTNQTNIVSGSGIATPDALQTDLASAIAARRLLVDDKGDEISVGDEKISVVLPAKNASLWRLSRLAFMDPRVVLPSDDSARDMWSMVNEIIYDPFLTNNNDWYVHFLPSGAKPALKRVMRQAPKTTTWYDEFNEAQIIKVRSRYEVGFTDWTQWVQIDN